MSWPDTESWLWILGLAIVSGIGGHLLMSVSIPHLPLWASSTMTLSIPVISTVTAAIFLGESVAPAQVVGMGIVLVALAAAIRVSSGPRRPATDGIVMRAQGSASVPGSGDQTERRGGC